jgi:hypothetical protein
MQGQNDTLFFCPMGSGPQYYRGDVSLWSGIAGAIVPLPSITILFLPLKVKLGDLSAAGGDSNSYEKGRNDDLFSETLLWKIVS